MDTLYSKGFLVIGHVNFPMLCFIAKIANQKKQTICYTNSIFTEKSTFNYSAKTLAFDKLKSYFNNNKKNTTTFYRNDSLLKNS